MGEACRSTRRRTGARWCRSSCRSSSSMSRPRSPANPARPQVTPPGPIRLTEDRARRRRLPGSSPSVRVRGRPGQPGQRPPPVLLWGPNPAPPPILLRRLMPTLFQPPILGPPPALLRRRTPTAIPRPRGSPTMTFLRMPGPDDPPGSRAGLRSRPSVALTRPHRDRDGAGILSPRSPRVPDACGRPRQFGGGGGSSVQAEAVRSRRRADRGGVPDPPGNPEGHAPSGRSAGPKGVARYIHAKWPRRFVTWLHQAAEPPESLRGIATPRKPGSVAAVAADSRRKAWRRAGQGSPRHRPRPAPPRHRPRPAPPPPVDQARATPPSARAGPPRPLLAPAAFAKRQNRPPSMLAPDLPR